MVTTSEDVARRAGVSRSAVSQILNGRPARFSADTRARVLQAAAELEYHPSSAGRTLARGASDIVIAVVPNTTLGGGLQDIFETMTDELAAQGLSLLLRLATRTESLDRMIARIRPAAVFSLTPFTDPERALLARREVPAVDPTSVIGTDYNRAIGVAQARHLVERGYARLAFARLHDARQDTFGDTRVDGVRQVCREADLADPVVVGLAIEPADALAALEALEPPGVAVACYNDDVAAALLSAAVTRGWSLPDAVALIGAHATPISRVTLPPLSTVAYDLLAMVTSSTHVVLSMLGRPTPRPEPSGEPIRVIPRGTT